MYYYWERSFEEIPSNAPNILYPKDNPDVDRIRGDILPKMGLWYQERLVSAFYTPEQIVILEKLLWVGIPEYHISVLFSLFGDAYIWGEYEHIVKRWNEAKRLVDAIASHDEEFLDDNWLIQGNGTTPFNTKLYKILNTRVLDAMKGEILIDLFSQWNEDLLWFGINRNRGTVSTCSSRIGFHVLGEGEEYAFYPQTLICVDVQNEDNQHDQKQRNWETTDVYKLVSDALLFLSLLPDNAVHYVLSGVDGFIINAEYQLWRDYIQLLNQEIYRTTKQWGMICGYLYTYRKQLLELGMNAITEAEGGVFGNWWYVYQK